MAAFWPENIVSVFELYLKLSRPVTAALPGCFEPLTFWKYYIPENNISSSKNISESEIKKYFFVDLLCMWCTYFCGLNHMKT